MARVITDRGLAWLKLCRPIQAFEPRLTAGLFERWPDRVVRVLAHDAARAWLLTDDAGSPLGDLGNPPERWLEILPRYAELQAREASRATAHLDAGVPDQRLATLPPKFERLVAAELPIGEADLRRLREHVPRYEQLCADLQAAFPCDTVQHDDLHLRSVFADGTTLRILDWGDTSVGHPFASQVATFRFLESANRLPPGDPWFERLRDAYLEPWGGGLTGAFEIAFRVGAVAHAVAWLRHRDAMTAGARADFDGPFGDLLRWVLARAVD